MSAGDDFEAVVEKSRFHREQLIEKALTEEVYCNLALDLLNELASGSAGIPVVWTREALKETVRRAGPGHWAYGALFEGTDK